MDRFVVFIVTSSVYLVLLSVTDGLFNRLIFRKGRELPYDSNLKKRIYERWEWRAIGVIFLICLSMVLPLVVSFLVGGLDYIILYLIVLFIIPWDMIFGKLVFNDIFGDMPSIALPFLGWVRLPLWLMTAVRFVIAAFLYFWILT